MKTAFLATLAATALVPAYPQEKAPGSAEIKIVELKYADPRSIENMLSVFGCCTRINEATRTISLRFPPDQMKAVEEAIRRFDVPSAAPKDIDLTAWFLVASEKPEASGAPVPPELEPVVKQVRAVFALKNFSLLDTLLIRAGSGQGGEATGQIGALRSQFLIRRWALRENVVSIDELRAGLRVPTSVGGKVSYDFTGINLNRIDVPVGQRVVIGRSSMEGPGKALLVVLTAKVL